jgi:class 3 adenylate cyclase/tetratricopeptide (TPR) repeat protein
LNAGESAAERRQTTVLFCDLVGSTTLSARLDPEDMMEVLQQFLHTARAVVEQHQGFIARYMGDGVLVYFGYPCADEYSAEGAVRAALDLVRRVSALEPLPGVLLRVRIGIATGVVVIGNLIGSGASSEAPAWGATPNLAARLQAMASPDTVLISDETYALVGMLFECNALGLHRLKGFTEPVLVWEAVAARSVESRFSAMRPTAALARLVGRKDELSRLASAWEMVATGQGQLACVRGDPGIGKSKLVSAFVNRLGLSPAAVVRLQCGPNLQATAFSPVVDHIQRLLDQLGDTNSAPEDTLQRILSSRYGLSAAQAQLVSDLVVPKVDTRFVLPDFASERRKEATVSALQDFLLGPGAQGPYVVLVEDAQWADPSTIELLARVVGGLERTPMLLLITCRPEFDAVGRIATPACAIELARLTERESAEIVSALSSGKPLPSDLMRLIIARADGVPLFVEELAQSILESSTLDELGDRYEYAEPAAHDSIPATLRDSLMARLDRQPAGKAIAQVAATIGREFNHDLLSAVTDLPDAELMAGIAALIEAGLIYPGSAGSLMFKHALVQEIARDSLLDRKRRELHRRIAGTIEGCFPDVARTRPEVLADHCMQGGLHHEAMDYSRLAALNAVRRFANEEAASNLRRALKMLALCPHSAERDARELELQAILGQVLTHTDAYVSAALDACCQRGRALSSASADAVHKAVVLRNECLSLVVQARYAAGHEAARELMQLGLASGQYGTQSAAEFVTGLSHLFRGQFILAREHLERGMQLANAHGLSDAAVQCQSFLGRVLWFLGHADQARKLCADALAVARRSPQSRLTAQTAGILAMVIHQCGDLGATRRWVRSALERSKAQGHSHWHALASILRSWLAAHERGAKSGATDIADSIAKYERTGARVGLSYFKVMQAEVEQHLGNIDQGMRAIEQALHYIGETGERYYAAEVERRHGELLLVSGEPLLAEAALARSLGIARDQKARIWELKAAASLFRLWSQQGQHERAQGLLAKIYATFDEGADTADLRDAATLLRDLGGLGAGSKAAGMAYQIDKDIGSA